jgi:integrase
VERTSGPLFRGYKEKRITCYGLYDRVQALGKQVGIERLYPHDLRHFFVMDALAQGPSLDRVQAAGNWKSLFLVLHSMERTRVANINVILTRESDKDEKNDQKTASTGIQ